MNLQHKQIENHKSAVTLKGQDLKKFNPTKVTTSYNGIIMQQIVNVAQEAGIEIDAESNLLEILATLDSNTLLPSEIIIMASEIVSCLYTIDNKTLISKD